MYKCVLLIWCVFYNRKLMNWINTLQQEVKLYLEKVFWYYCIGFIDYTNLEACADEDFDKTVSLLHAYCASCYHFLLSIRFWLFELEEPFIRGAPESLSLWPVWVFWCVLVGGGPAGCVLANRLSSDPDVSVLLLEAGGDEYEAGLMINVPLAASSNFLYPSAFWADLSDRQSYASKALKHSVSCCSYM